MGRQGGVDSLEHSGLQQPYLAAASLLRRGPDDHHGAGQILGVGLQPQGSAQGGHSYQVVPAPVSDLREGVVFGQDRDCRAVASAAGDDRPERRLDAAKTPLHREVMPFKEPGQRLGGVEFLVVQLRVGVDVFR